jgi:hypothetical protein
MMPKVTRPLVPSSQSGLSIQLLFFFGGKYRRKARKKNRRKGGREGRRVLRDVKYLTADSGVRARSNYSNY